MNRYFKPLIKSVLAVVCASVLASCESDVWKDHYSYKSDGNEAVSSLARTIESLPGTEDFVDVLRTTYMYNGDTQLRLTYWDLLNDDQYFTVWLPSSVPAEYKSSDPDKDHKKIGKEFILNHIARFSHPVGSATKERVKMMSDKSFRSLSGNIAGVSYADQTNIRCSNGLIHKLNGSIAYSPNMYDYLTGAVSYKSANDSLYDYNSVFGKWFAQYTVEKIDEEKSVAGEINANGEVEWIDKVIIRSNELMKKFGYINVEDSDYIVVLPTPSLWKSVYDTIKYYYTYNDSLVYRDSMQQYWTNYAMLTDAFFNRNIQYHENDSVTSTLFSMTERLTEKYPYHVFYRPNDAGGLFADRIDSVICSNGVVYVRDSWPFSDSTFRRTIKIEAEDYEFEGTKKATRYTAQYMGADSTVRSVVVKQLDKAVAKYRLDCEVTDNLRGKYKLKVVVVPNTTAGVPSLIHPVVSYISGTKADTLSGGQRWVWYARQGGRWRNDIKAAADEVGKDFVNLRPDTVVIGPFEIPYCDYKTNDPRLQVSILSAVEESAVGDGTYTKEIWLDCIMLEPVFE